MIYILIESHLTGIDFVWNGKILIKKKAPANDKSNIKQKKTVDAGPLQDGKMSKFKPKAHTHD